MQDKLDGLFLTDTRHDASGYDMPHIKCITLHNASNNQLSLGSFQVWSQFEGLLHKFDDGDRLRGRGHLNLVDNLPRTRNRVDTLLLVNTDSAEYITTAKIDVLPFGFPGTQRVGLWHQDTRRHSDMSIPCFTAGTIVSTRMGEKQIEDLRPGDDVLTRDAGFVPIQAISRQSYSPAEQRLNRNVRPVVLPAGTFGNTRDLHLSPAHRLMISDPAAQFMFNEPEVLVAAKTALAYGLVHQQSADFDVTYYHILLDHHALIHVEGIWVESLFLGDMPERVLSNGKHWDMAHGFDMQAAHHDCTARPVLRGFEARALMERLPNRTALAARTVAPNPAFRQVA